MGDTHVGERSAYGFEKVGNSQSARKRAPDGKDEKRIVDIPRIGARQCVNSLGRKLQHGDY